MNDKTPRRCLALYSGGLDSLLAIRLMEDQGIEVIPLFFCSPFFGFGALRDPDTFTAVHRERYGLNILIVDYTEDMTSIIKAPRHGFGKHLNPCIDCKIGMLRRSNALLETLHASFVITGEVLGQRPMSQRGHVMRAIEKESGLEDILLRPLCARNMVETLPERLGIVDRGALWDIRGRGRKIQIEKALAYGITEDLIPTPAGGCLLTQEQISKKVRRTYERFSPVLPLKEDLVLDVVGRKFILDEVTVLVVGRDDEENKVLSSFIASGNTFMKIADVPGPLCVLRGDAKEANLMIAAGICLRYGKARGINGQTALYGSDPECMDKTVQAHLLNEEYCKSMQD
jgi:tRNA-specific 2-thiouridylase